MNRKRLILLIITGGFIFAGYFFLRPSSNAHDVANGVFANRQNFDAFMAASEATVQRVHYKGESKGNEGALRDRGYIHETQFQIPSEQREELKRLLAAKSSYAWGIEKGCGPEYAMLVHFRSSNSVISVGFCFDCKELVVLKSDSNLVKKLNIEYNFDPISSELAAIARSIFPNDPEIRAVK